MRLVPPPEEYLRLRRNGGAHAPVGMASSSLPGGSVRDEESIQACDEHGIAMVFTGHRHFRH